MTPKKRKRLIKEENAYESEELTEPGLFDDDDGNDEDFDEKEAWRYYG